ncbi:DNA glycosylase, partial [Melanomma pulvis-pyrius CBS 109.77]
LQPSYFGLIQERIRGDLFALVLQTILWNQTTAKAARPVLFRLLSAYPTPEVLAASSHEDVLKIIRTLGLQEKRTTRIIELAKTWVAAPPCLTRRYARRHYPTFCSDMRLRLKDGELLPLNDPRPGWEIAHLPGVGPYALDSYRIFYRDTLWGVEEGDGIEPEWKRVVPLDKDLRAYLVWKWKQEGWEYNVETGTRTRR